MTNIFSARVVKGRDCHSQLLHYTVMLEAILQIPQVFFFFSKLVMMIALEKGN